MKFLEILWSWPTIVGVVLILYHKEIRTLLHRVSRSSRAKIGSIEIEIPEEEAVKRGTIEVVSGKVFGAERIDLDGKRFTKCHFIGSTLIFAGRNHTALDGCIFEGVLWEFSGPAASTIQFMHALYHGGGKDIIERTFEDRVRAEGS